MSVDGMHDGMSATDMLNGIQLAGPGAILLADDVSDSFPSVISFWGELLDAGYITGSTCIEGPMVGLYKKRWCYATVAKTSGSLDARAVKPNGQVKISEEVTAAVKRVSSPKEAVSPRPGFSLA